MSKSSRKPSKAQRDKINVEVAKKLKKAGIISKQAKLHSGRYISKKVLAKVRKYTDIANLNYGTVKVSRDIAKKAKEHGYEIVQGNRIIGPKTNTFRARVKRGDVVGVKPIKGGYMEEIVLPHDIFDLSTLFQKFGLGAIDDLKMPEEHFAFKMYGHESYRTFPNSKALADYLMQYSNITENDEYGVFESLTVFRLHPANTSKVIPGAEARKKRARQARSQRTNKPSKYRSRDDLSILQLKRVRDRDLEKKHRKRDKIKSDPVAYEEYKRKERERKKRK